MQGTNHTNGTETQTIWERKGFKTESSLHVSKVGHFRLAEGSFGKKVIVNTYPMSNISDTFHCFSLLSITAQSLSPQLISFLSTKKRSS